MANDPNDLWTSLAQILGDYEKGSAQGRVAQAGAQNAYDNTANSYYKTAMDAAINGPAAEAGQAVRGDLLQSLQPTQFSGLPSYIKMPQMSGGLSPANLGPSSRAAGALLSKNAILNLASNKFGVPTMPTQTPLPQASGLDKGLSLGTLGAGILGVLNHGQTGPTAQDPSGNGGKPTGSGASFTLPWSGFQWGSNFNTNDGLPSYDPYSQNPDTGTPNDPLGMPTGAPSSAMDEYYAWLAQQNAGGSDATPSAGDDWGNP